MQSLLVKYEMWLRDIYPSQHPDITEQDRQFALENRKELAFAYMRRADEAGTAIRVVLMTLSVAGIGFVLHEHSVHIGWHFLSGVAFLLAAFSIYASWELQKDKSIERINALRNSDYDRYFEQMKRSNSAMDRTAFGLLLVGILLELAL